MAPILGSARVRVVVDAIIHRDGDGLIRVHGTRFTRKISAPCLKTNNTLLSLNVPLVETGSGNDDTALMKSDFSLAVHRLKEGESPWSGCWPVGRVVLRLAPRVPKLSELGAGEKLVAV
jgi:hypothetical protein